MDPMESTCRPRNKTERSTGALARTILGEIMLGSVLESLRFGSWPWANICGHRVPLVHIVPASKSLHCHRSGETHRRGKPPCMTMGDRNRPGAITSAHGCSSRLRLGGIVLQTTGILHRSGSSSILPPRTVGSSPGVVSVPGKPSHLVCFVPYAGRSLGFGD
jgi:hypothetical protein